MLFFVSAGVVVVVFFCLYKVDVKNTTKINKSKRKRCVCVRLKVGELWVVFVSSSSEKKEKEKKKYKSPNYDES